MDEATGLAEAMLIWLEWLMRAFVSLIVITVLAIILKFTLLAPVTELEYKLKVNSILKGGLEI